MFSLLYRLSSRRSLLATSALTLVLTACGEAPAPTQTSAAAPAASATEQFHRFLDEAYALDMERRPYSASYRGIRDYQDRWNSVDEAFYDETRRINEERLAYLENEVDRTALEPAAQLSYDIYRLDLQRRLAADEFRHHRFVIHQHRGPHTSVVSGLINLHPIRTVADAEDYIARLGNVEDYFGGVIEQLEIRGEENFLLADWQYPKIVDAARNVLQGYPFDADDNDPSVIWDDFTRKVAALDIPEAEHERLLAAAREALTDELAPAYADLIAALQAQGRNALDADGVWKFARGDEFYAERLRWFTTTDMSADEIHELGLEQVARVHDEMRAIMDRVGFEGSLQDFFVFMRENDRFYYPNTDEGRAEYLAAAKAAIEAMKEKLPEAFGLLPEADIVVRRVEAFRERTAGKAFYQSPPPDGSRPGIYYANLYDMDSMPTYQLEALAFHEGIPGHHMQRAITVELEDIPEFQKYASFTAFTEGWALYTEQLAKEMGFYEDPYSDFGRLAMELWRACRLVVDTGLHSRQWTREKAIDYLVANTPNAEADAIKAIERYIAMPGQATAYMVGKLKILELREAAREALGERFSLADFHDEVLKDGPVPLSILEDKIDALIDRTLADAQLAVNAS